MEDASLTTPPRMDVKPSSIEARTPPVRRENGKVTSLITIGSIGPKSRTR